MSGDEMWNVSLISLESQNLNSRKMMDEYTELLCSINIGRLP